MQILLVDDDRDLVEVLTFALKRAGFGVLPALDSPTALKLLEEKRPDLAIIDINLGRWNGFDFLKTLRRRSSIPAIILTARSAEDDKVLGFDLGADDYVTKPFSHRELIARVRANLKRQGFEWSPSQPTGGLLRAGTITMNLAEHTVVVDGRVLELTLTEFRLLRYLMTNAGTVLSSSSILKYVWNYEDSQRTDVVRVTIHRLRQKLEEDPIAPKLLLSAPQGGFVLEPRTP